jgi:putative peptide zinc metalloprotease protein
MEKTAPANELERRKQVRMRLRSDLDIAPQRYEGRTYFVVKDPVSLRYYRFKEDEHYLLQFMCGKHTLDEAQKEYERRYRPQRLTLEDLESFAQQLLTAGLVQNESPRAGTQLFERRKKRRRSEWMQTLTNILYIKIPVIDPDKILTDMLPYSRWIFTIPFLLASIGVMLAALLLIATHFDTFWDKLPTYRAFFSFQTIFYLWFSLGMVKIIHEFGHGLSCKAFNGEVHEMGMLFLCLSPCMYCNVSDSWTLPDKWKRIIISSAGIYVELIIASLATFVWWNTPGYPLINNLSLSLMVVCSVSTVVFNANPLMRYDGYYILADWLEIPNLRDRSNKFLKNLSLQVFLGVEVPEEAYMALWRRVLFVVYAIVSYIYRWVVTFSILYFMYSFLKPYKLGVVSGFLALFAAGSMIGWPFVRLGKNIHKRGRLPDMKRSRVTGTCLIVLGLLLFTFFVPLPISRVRQQGLVQVQPDSITHVFIQTPGRLEELLVRDGDWVEQGTVLAKLRSPTLESKLQDEEMKVQISGPEIDDLNRKLNGERMGKRERDDLLRRREETRANLETAMARRDTLKKQIDQELTLRAPRSGVVMSPPYVDEVGKTFEPDPNRPFCGIGDPSRLRILVPVSPAEYRLLKSDLDLLQKKNQDLDVTIRVQGRGSHTWHGRLSLLPEDDAKEVPIALTDRAGGPIAVQPGTAKPLTQQYLLAVDILDPDEAIIPGSLGQVKVHCRWRTTAWFLYRTISNKFDLGLQ